MKTGLTLLAAMTVFSTTAISQVPMPSVAPAPPAATTNRVYGVYDGCDGLGQYTVQEMSKNGKTYLLAVFDSRSVRGDVSTDGGGVFHSLFPMRERVTISSGPNAFFCATNPTDPPQLFFKQRPCGTNHEEILSSTNGLTWRAFYTLLPSTNSGELTSTKTEVK